MHCQRINMYFISITVDCNMTPYTSANKNPDSEKHVFSNISGEMKASLSFEVNVWINIQNYTAVYLSRFFCLWNLKSLRLLNYLSIVKLYEYIGLSHFHIPVQRSSVYSQYFSIR